MIVVTKIETMKTDRDPIEIVKECEQQGYARELMDPAFKDVPPDQRYERFSEWIHGREFIIPETREKIIIGFSHQAAREIGIHLEVWENMKHQHSKATADNRWLSGQLEMEKKKLKQAEEIIDEFIHLGFWTRLKFLFTRRV